MINMFISNSAMKVFFGWMLCAYYTSLHINALNTHLAAHKFYLLLKHN